MEEVQGTQKSEEGTSALWVVNQAALIGQHDMKRWPPRV